MVKVLILGASGMLGNAMLRAFAGRPDFSVAGTIRSASSRALFEPFLQKHLVVAGDIDNADALINAFASTQPQVVINCIGLIKQLGNANDPLAALPVNALLPHRIAKLCALAGARMVHISTDCVFSGKAGGYNESDFPDAVDLYGRSKLLGEVDYPNAVTIRTSIIGHELSGANGLIGWFLAQKESCSGYTHAVFSGLPTGELARVIRDVVLSKPELRGTYHVASSPINKFDLLCLVAEVYGKKIAVVPDDSVVIDRSLDGTRFKTATGYATPPWAQLVAQMHHDRPALNV